MTHGMQKLLGFPAPAPMPIALFSLFGLAGVLELAHAPNNFWPLPNGGDAAVLYCFVFLFLAVAGAGPWSVDRARNAA